MITQSAFKLRARLRAEDWARRRRIGQYPALLKLLTTSSSTSEQWVENATNYLVSNQHQPSHSRLVSRSIELLRKPIGTRADSHPYRIDLDRCILIKPRISEEERGVMVVSFEAELDAIVCHPKFTEFERNYLIAFLPSWQPAYSKPLLRLAAKAQRPFVVMPASPADQALYKELGPLCKPLRYQAASWVSGTQFEPTEKKDYDIILLALFGKYKRHWKLFEGIGQIPDRLKVVLAGKPWEGRGVARLRAEMKAFGCNSNVEIVEDPSQASIPNLLARSRLFCAMSQKEGSFVAVAEALMSGTPVAMYKDAVIGTKQFINDQTGFLLDPDRPLGPQLMAALARTATLNPREWALREISAEASVPRFNADLQQLATAAGEVWTRDIAPFHSRALYFYFRKDADQRALSEERQRLAEYYGITFGERPDLMSTPGG